MGWKLLYPVSGSAPVSQPTARRIAPPTSDKPTAPLSEARQLVERARALQSIQPPETSYFGNRDSPRMREILALTEKALALEPDSAEAHAMRGASLWLAWRLWTRNESCARRFV